MKISVLALAGVAMTLATPALAKDVTVHMRTSSPAGLMVFEPSFVKADVGDVVHFVPSDPGHNAETIPTMLPAGVAPSNGQMGKEFVLTLSKAGVYGIKCKPHYAMGMVALIQAGNGPSANLAAAKAVVLPGLAAKRMTAAFAKAK